MAKQRLKALSSTRPPTIKPTPRLSSKKTRTIIRTHHTLEKQKATALAKGDTASAAKTAALIEAAGGLSTYQKASLLGQDETRGGDSSKVLLEWLDAVVPDLKLRGPDESLRMLEVGALSTRNVCARSGLFDITRIDLNSQADGILKQDFMERPLPEVDDEKFDIISLSLVLNYVPDPVGRGEMLRRTLQFLRQTGGSALDAVAEFFPCLFLVLPAPCVSNSRDMDEDRLEAIMRNIGYTKIESKISNKLIYQLWRAVAVDVTPKHASFKKVELRPGGARNNFSIVLR